MGGGGWAEAERGIRTNTETDVAGGKLDVTDSLTFTKGGSTHSIEVTVDDDGVHVGCTLLSWEAWYWIKHEVARRDG